MRIAQVAPLYESVPPQTYGGTERVVSYLTEELVRQGHDVTLFASADSRTAARLVSSCPRSLRLSPDVTNPLVHHIIMLDELWELSEDFDVIHFHTDFLHFLGTRTCQTPHVTTLHGRLDLPDLAPLYRRFARVPVVSISDSQRHPLPWINWQGTVYHGLPVGMCNASGPRRSNGYLAFLGRISREKGPDRAIEIAHRAGRELRIAAKVDPADQDYFEKEIRPLMDTPGVTFVGEINEQEKCRFLGDADALLFPIDWPEPFGLVMIESLACGTPVIAWRCGSVPEVIDHGATGFICDSIDSSVEAVARINSLSRDRCRRVFEERFQVERMASDYLNIYQRLIMGRNPVPQGQIIDG